MKLSQANGKIDYDNIDASTTVQDLLDAIELYLQDHPLPCGSCPDSCCKKPWAVEVDNVCVRRIAKRDETAEGAFIRDNLVLKRNHAMSIWQYILKKEKACRFITRENRCTNYKIRPVICRLYLCTANSSRYDKLRELIGATYLQALVMEVKMREKQLSARTMKKYMHNPAIHANDYTSTLQAVIRYARFRGWIDSGECLEY